GDIVWDGMMFDITERKQAEAERDRFFDCALDLFCIVGFDGYFQRLNPAWETTLGYSIAELKSQPFLTWVHPDDLETTATEAGNIAEGGNTLWFENRYRTRDGSYRWLAWKTVSFPEEQVMYAIARDITESKEIEIERERLIEILEASPDLISSADLEGKITYMNRGGKALLGLNLDTDITQYCIEDFVPDNMRATFNTEAIPTTLETGKWRGTTRLCRVDGESFPTSQAILAHEATPDREAYLSTIVRDISEIQAIEERLRQQEQFLRTIYDNQGNVVFVVDVGKDGIFRYASFNATARELLEIDQDEICGQTPIQVFGETTGQQLKQYYQQCLDSQQRITYETTLTLGDRELYFQEVLTPLKDPQGRIYRLVVNSTDISDRRIAELALQVSEAKHRHSARREKIVNHINQQIRQSLDLKTILETSVREIYELLGVDRCYCLWYRQTDNKSQFEIGAEAKHDRLPSHLNYYSSPVFDVLTTVLQQQGSIQLDNVGKVKDACTREQLQQFGYKSLLLFPIETGENSLAMLACSREMMPQSWQDREVELLQTVCDNLAIAIQQAALYQKATTKSQELEHTLTRLQQTQAQLIQAEKMSGLGQLVAGVAHEINNPISFIFGNLFHAQEYTQDLLQLIHLYKDSILEPPIEIQTYSEDIDLDYLINDLPKLFKSMHSGAVRIREIVQSLRTFSRLDESETKTINLHENLDSTLTILASRLRNPKTQKEIQVIRDYGDLPLVSCYAGPLNQVFMNLMANALDAIEAKNEAGGCLQIKTTRLAGDRVQIQIIDNGTGIKAETRDRIFDPFYTTKPIGQGTGLGLSISYQIIVERHQGKLICDSTPGEGTTFTIEIPG
ncbi:MAG: PAS domain S-box protein, partial [Spirulinaceae cyanobacterium]